MVLLGPCSTLRDPRGRGYLCAGAHRPHFVQLCCAAERRRCMSMNRERGRTAVVTCAFKSRDLRWSARLWLARLGMQGKRSRRRRCRPHVNALSTRVSVVGADLRYHACRGGARTAPRDCERLHRRSSTCQGLDMQESTLPLHVTVQLPLTVVPRLSLDCPAL